MLATRALEEDQADIARLSKDPVGQDLRRHQLGTKALSSATTHVAMVRRLFPEWGEEVLRLALSNETFRELCEEYGLAVQALTMLEQRNRPQDAERMNEYSTLIKQLEKDLEHEFRTAHDNRTHKL